MIYICTRTWCIHSFFFLFSSRLSDNYTRLSTYISRATQPQTLLSFVFYNVLITASLSSLLETKAKSV